MKGFNATVRFIYFVCFSPLLLRDRFGGIANLFVRY